MMGSCPDAEKRIAELEARLARQERELEEYRRNEQNMDLIRGRDPEAAALSGALREKGLQKKGIVVQIFELTVTEENRIGLRYFVRTELLETIRGALPDSRGICMCFGREADRCYVLAALDMTAGRDFEKWNHETAHRLLTAAQEFPGYAVMLNVSTAVLGTGNIREAYGSLQQIRAYREFLGDDSPCMFYDEIRERLTDRDGTYRPEKFFTQALQMRHYDEAREHLAAFLREQYQDSAPGVRDLRSRNDRIINPLMDTLSDLSEGYTEDSREAAAIVKMRSRLLHIPSVEELRRTCEDGISLLETLQNRSTEGECPRWVHNVTKFVDKNYMNPQISVTYLADMVRITPVHLSRVFRKCYNMSVMDYVHGKRVQEAKVLLQNGCSVKNTTEKVGYVSQITMTRAFRRYDGQTPGYYAQTRKAANI